MSIVRYFTRIITTTISQFAPELISSYQTGFMKKRFISDNAVGAFLAMSHAKITNKSSALLLLDQEKAYDRINLTYLDKVLCKFGFPLIFRGRII